MAYPDLNFGWGNVNDPYYFISKMEEYKLISHFYLRRISRMCKSAGSSQILLNSDRGEGDYDKMKKAQISALLQWS